MKPSSPSCGRLGRPAAVRVRRGEDARRPNVGRVGVRRLLPRQALDGYPDERFQPLRLPARRKNGGSQQFQTVLGPNAALNAIVGENTSWCACSSHFSLSGGLGVFSSPMPVERAMAFTIMRSGVFTILAGKTLAGPKVSKGGTGAARVKPAARRPAIMIARRRG